MGKNQLFDLEKKKKQKRMEKMGEKREKEGKEKKWKGQREETGIIYFKIT